MSSGVESNDLSPYELARLERIKRNEDRLRSLGLLRTAAIQPSAENKTKKKRTAPQRRERTPAVPTRSSKRLRALKDSKLDDEEIGEEDDAINGGDAEDEASDAGGEVNYNIMPQETDHLDDSEFQVYVTLRAWRLRRKNELEVEPYKICQNRTFCELIRKRRNENGFAARNNKNEEEVEKDLLSVWGIGPSKAAAGGFGWEMLEVLDTDENAKLLDLSRGKTE